MSRRLAGDAAAFLDRIAGAIGFPEGGDSDALAAFLAAERARLGGQPDLESLTPAERAVRTRDGVAGDSVRFRAYEPDSEAAVPRATIVFIHGGGWVSGGIDQHDRTCRILAVAAGARVLSVDYRLAPEHPFPAPLDDCERVLELAVRTAHGAPVAVMGFSSGGTLAAALVLRARGRSDPGIGLQVLVYPALDATLDAPSYRADENGQGYFVSTAQMAWYWEQYRGSARSDEPEFAPLAAPELTGLPPALVVTAEFDPLRDDGSRYADRLIGAGVPVRRMHFPGMIHGFLGLIDDIRDALPALRSLGATIGTALAARSGTAEQGAVWWTTAADEERAER